MCVGSAISTTVLVLDNVLFLCACMGDYVSFSKNLESGMLPARVQPKAVPRNRVKVGKTPGLAYPHFRVCGLLVGHFCPTNSPARVQPRFYCFFSKSTGEAPSTLASIPCVRGPVYKTALFLKQGGYIPARVCSTTKRRRVWAARFNLGSFPLACMREPIFCDDLTNR